MAMPDYITDMIHTALSVRRPSKALKFEASKFPAMMNDIKTRTGQLEDRELYAFSRSALNAASDLRIDTPDRVDRLVDAVLSTQRRLFIEADALDIAVINENLRGLLSPLPHPPVPRTRWGAFVDVLGNGRARYHVVISRPKEVIKGNPALAEDLVRSRQFEGRLPEAAMAALGLEFSSWRADIDISRHVGMSLSEFKAAIARISTSHDPIAKFGAEAAARASGVRERDRIISDTWRALRFRDILRVQSTNDGAIASPQDKLDALRSGLPVVALLAVLAAEGGDISSTPRPRSERKPSRPSSGSGGTPASELRIVTLNLEDRDLQRIYEGKGVASEASTSSSSEHGRVRHPVRGHLFLARNGRMTWRKPHWRGSLEKPLLHRVVAPSHK